MAINVPPDVDHAIRAAVERGQFASVEDAVAEAWRYFERQRLTMKVQPQPPADDADPILGWANDHADLLDEIVEIAMQRRERRS